MICLHVTISQNKPHFAYSVTLSTIIEQMEQEDTNQTLRQVYDGAKFSFFVTAIFFLVIREATYNFNV